MNSEKITGVLAIVSTVVTMAVTIWNVVINYEVRSNERIVGEKKQQIDEKTAAFTQSIQGRGTDREDYEFIKSLINDYTSADKTKRAYAESLVRFVLDDEKEKEFFYALSLSPDQNLKDAGNTGLDKIKADAPKKAVAHAKEQEGLNKLAEGNFGDAQKSFEEAENAFPSYRNVSEINDLLKSKQPELSTNEAAKKEVLQKIVTEYSAKIPYETRAKLEKAAR